MDQLHLLIIVFTLLFSAFFSGMEIAFITANKLKIELDNKQGIFSGRILSHFLKYPSRFIGTMLVGNNISLVVYSISMTIILEPWISKFFDSAWFILILQTIIATLLILFIAEFAPKSLFSINSNRSLKYFAIPVYIIYLLLYPIVFIIIGLAEWFLKNFMKVKLSDNKIHFGKMDLYYFVKEAADAKKEDEEMGREIQIFQNALDFSNVKARDCMVPRTEIIALDVDDTIDNLHNNFIQTGLSKILIYRDTIDNIIGYTHSYDIFKSPKNITSILLPVSIIPETMPANEILESFIKERRNVAVVVDEFGGTSGMITVEDIVEEIFGEIEDEHDKEDFVEKKINEFEFDLSARLEIDYLNEKYNFGLPESDEYKTLGGLILHQHENIPNLKETIIIKNFSFTITEVSENRLERVLMKIVSI